MVQDSQTKEDEEEGKKKEGIEEESGRDGERQKLKIKASKIKFKNQS
jgi:hypothetical protein